MKKNIQILLFVLLAGVFLYSAWRLGSYYLTAFQQEKTVGSLRGQLNEEDPYAVNEDGILVRYADLYAENHDMVGWLTISDTPIDYPVMQTPETPDFYLKRGFDKKYSAYGMIYMDEDCDLDAGCPNFVLYGHHMKNGSMFAALEKYTSEEFYREHPEILFDTLEETGRYQVAAVFKMPGAQITEAFAGTLLAATEEDYNAFIAYAKENSLYDTGVTPQWPEQLLTLGTCEYTYEDGRLFVVGRKAGHDGP